MPHMCLIIFSLSLSLFYIYPSPKSLPEGNREEIGFTFEVQK